MTQTLTRMPESTWVDVCPFGRLLPDRGVCALVGRTQVAVFRTGGDALYAVSNWDPFGRAPVISRGLVGSVGDEPKVASPLLKHTFSLVTGRCFEDPGVALDTFAVRVHRGTVQVSTP